MPPPPHTKPENVLKVGHRAPLSDVQAALNMDGLHIANASEHKNSSLLSSLQLLSLSYTNMSRPKDLGIAPSHLLNL